MAGSLTPRVTPDIAGGVTVRQKVVPQATWSTAMARHLQAEFLECHIADRRLPLSDVLEAIAPGTQPHMRAQPLALDGFPLWPTV